MRIALVSYECPPDTALGGIGTYTRNAARSLAEVGQEVEVFSASPTRSGSFAEDGFVIHRIQHADPSTFREAVIPAFLEKHNTLPFDVVEGPDYQADAAGIVRCLPRLPLVVRLHTPRYLLNRISATTGSVSRLKELRITIGRWRRWAWRYDGYDQPAYALERSHTFDADVIASPSSSLAAIIAHDWRIPRSRIDVHPNIFVPTPQLLDVKEGDSSGGVLFVGRLQDLKGVTDLMDAAPAILAAHPGAKIRLLGSGGASPAEHHETVRRLTARCGPAAEALEFLGHHGPQRLAMEMARSQVCVFPSHWEAFGYVCVEAMAAGRAIVASHVGGMADLLDHGRCGVLIPPRAPDQIAQAINQLLDDSQKCRELGEAARRRLLSDYDCATVTQQQIELYRTAISRRERLGSR